MTSVHDGDHEGSEDNLDGGITPLTANDPARVGPYLLLGRLGAGGMGRVYLARSEGGRTVAVKVVHTEHVADPQFRARFRREVEAARRVDERYTAPVLDAAPDEEYPWVATGYVPGLSLEQIVRGHGALTADAVLALADGLLRALKDIHAAGIVHRDLKPSNVMVTVEGPKVIDFGIARGVETSVESLLTSTGMVIGSPGFMAPEQIRGESAGPKSDVFTLGCVLTYAATGTLPFGNGVSNQHAVMYHIVEAEPDLSAVRDERLHALIGRLLTKSAAERPGVDELLAESGRKGPEAAASWLPAGVVAHLARQSARLLDAEAAPVRQEGPDRATLGLRPAADASSALPAGAVTSAKPTPEPEPEPRPEPEPKPKAEREARRRRLVVSVPLVLVLAGGGGTLAVLQPFSGDSGSHAAPPSSSGPGTPGPASPDGTPAQGDKTPQASESEAKGKGKGKDKTKDKGGERGEDGKDGRDGQKGEDGRKSPAGGGGSGSASGGGGGSTSTGGGSGSGGSSSGGGSSTSGGSTGGSGNGGSSSTSGGSTGGSTGGSSDGGTVPASFVGTWKYGKSYNVGRPGTIVISKSGVVRLSESPIAPCSYEAKVISTAYSGSRINISVAKQVGASNPMCYSTLDESFFTRNGSGLQHNVGPSAGDGYYYKRA
ncbi:serine/threonine-protein kinase [Streptomyces sp. ITFR-16]|uniref:serine/threonine-protein kinase n=1 Tax=Streptomyces sp. ITFR-16 TaxID=3075198 RepID=UPI00288C1F6D|nr:serine/threonine-protein kinase [Streptomyces sp. ITFR-16]WNI21635.1 serine/threonine-protein kinase [Streptomyces sp. ITFR-16]